MKNPLFEHSHPLTKILFLLFIIVVSFTIFLIVGLITAIPLFNLNIASFKDALNVNNPENIGLIKYMQFIQHLSIFVVPPIVAAYIFSKNPGNYLRATNVNNDVLLFVVAAGIMLFAIPLINYTGALNANLKLPESMSGFEAKIKAMEESAAKMTEAFLNVHTLGGLFVNLLLVALMPAVGEEFLFRGVLLKLFKDWTKNKHAAILITAFLFSAVHFQFYGFLSRFLLGVLFGYLFVWSGNIWVPVTVHFLNNGLAVVLYYFSKGSGFYEKIDKTGAEGISSATVLFSLVFTVLLMLLFVKITKKNQSIGQEY